MQTSKTTITKLKKYAPCRTVKSPMSCKLLYMMLTDISNSDGQVALSQREISGALRISKSTVSRGMNRLRKSKHLYKIPQYDNRGRRVSTLYQLR